MGDIEVKALKEDIAEIKASLKEIFTMVNDMRVSIAGEYVTRKDKSDCQKEVLTLIKKYEENSSSLIKDHEEKDRTTRRWWAGYIITSAGVLMTAIKLYM